MAKIKIKDKDGSLTNQQRQVARAALKVMTPAEQRRLVKAEKAWWNTATMKLEIK